MTKFPQPLCVHKKRTMVGNIFRLLATKLGHTPTVKMRCVVPEMFWLISSSAMNSPRHIQYF